MTPEERLKVAEILRLVIGAQSAALDAAADDKNRRHHIEKVCNRLDQVLKLGVDLGMIGAGTIEVRTQP